MDFVKTLYRHMFFFKDLFYVMLSSVLFAYVFMCTTCLPGACGGQKKTQISWNWGCRQSGGILWIWEQNQVLVKSHLSSPM